MGAVFGTLSALTALGVTAMSAHGIALDPASILPPRCASTCSTPPGGC
jgi:hypothetical protein